MSVNMYIVPSFYFPQHISGYQFAVYPLPLAVLLRAEELLNHVVCVVVNKTPFVVWTI